MALPQARSRAGTEVDVRLAVTATATVAASLPGARAGAEAPDVMIEGKYLHTTVPPPLINYIDSVDVVLREEASTPATTSMYQA